MNNRVPSPPLTQDQQKAFDLMASGANVFITGLSGSGKSTVIKRFVDSFKNTRVCYITSTTGVSALLVKGRTIHSFAGIGLGTADAMRLCGKVASNKKAVMRWKKATVLIIDEVSMLSPELFEKLEFIARYIRDDSRPFGGIQLILSGDFCQLPCVDNPDFCFECDAWAKCVPNTVYLCQIMRQSDEAFQTILNEVRIGKLSSNTKQALLARVGVKLDNEMGIKPTKIFPTNSQSAMVNDKELKKLFVQGDVNSYEMDITCNNEEIKEKFLKNSIVEENIVLCTGAQVMLLFNMDIDAELVNGSRGVVTGFTAEDSLPIVKFLNGLEIIIPYNVWDVEEDGIVVLRACQIPLKVAYAVTIHKIQGCTLDYAEIDLSNVFEYGQAYVALSRVKKLENLSLIDIDFMKIRCNPKAKKYYADLVTERLAPPGGL
jgi:ATP-dependent DNA helicase PIF1